MFNEDCNTPLDGACVEIWHCNTEGKYDNKSDTLGINRRLIWEYQPGKRIFLVFNQSYLDERTGFVREQMDTTLKLSSIYRF